MTTLGQVIKLPPRPLDLQALVADVIMRDRHNSAIAAALNSTSGAPPSGLGPAHAVLASCTAWIHQDDDAHELCSLTACRNPLHPGPCKGWKHTLHLVSPGAYHQLEGERVRKANERRLKRIADLKAQNKPIPRKLLEEIKPKPAPTHGVSAVPLGQVGQKADLAGGQAHHAGHAVSNAAGITPSRPPVLPLGPKQKKPSVSGRGPAFVISQPKVTDQYKLDKADKITPQEWSQLSEGDKKIIRAELERIKKDGFGPQQKRADDLLTKLPAPAPAAPTPAHTPSAPAAPGKVSLGQAVKPVSTPAPAVPAATPTGLTNGAIAARRAVHGTGTDQFRVSEYERLTAADWASMPAVDKKLILSDLKDIKANGSMSNAGRAATVHTRLHDLTYKTTPSGQKVQIINLPAPAAPAAPAHVPSAPAAPSAPAGPLPQAAQQARAVAGRAVPKASMSKTHLDTYGKLTKAEFDQLDAKTQKTIRDDLANAKAKFLDPKKQKAAQDLLDRFGSLHPVSAPAAPGGAKGYSDPMNEAVKAVESGDRGTALARVSVLSKSSFKDMTKADQDKILTRLDAIRANPNNPDDQRSAAADLHRIISSGSAAETSRKWDHEPSFGELALAEKPKHAAPDTRVADALKAATDTTLPHADRVKALGAMDKAQFDALKPEEQRKITDALHSLHGGMRVNGSTVLDKEAEKALTAYTGQHPAIHRLQQAEADFRAGKIDGEKVYSELVHARVQAAGSKYGDPNSPYSKLEKEAKRVAEDNPTLPLWARASMIDNPYGKPAYRSVAAAQNRYKYNPAPRLSASDISDIFHTNTADLAQAHPVHAEAVRALREHIISTGLAPGSPWSEVTKGHVVDNLLHISYSEPEIPPDRLKDFRALPFAQQALVRKVMRDRLDAQTNDHAKTATWLAFRELRNDRALTATEHDAAKAAANSFARSDYLDTYHKLDPNEFDQLPGHVQGAILDHLHSLQKTAEIGGPVRTWAPLDDPLKVMPDALAAHLAGTRPLYSSRNQQIASDLANYGRSIVNPYDRYRQYSFVGPDKYLDMHHADQQAIETDLSRIGNDANNSLQVRYGALYTRDITLTKSNMAPNWNHVQALAVERADPHPGGAYDDGSVVSALNALNKSDYDSLDPTYREAIDTRIKALSSGSQQQALLAKFHPNAVPATPAGFTPTAQTTVQPHVQAALDTIYGVHPKSHTMAHQLSTYGALRGSDFHQLNTQEQNHLLSDLSFIATTAKGPSADKARKLIDRFTPAGTPAGHVPTPPVIPPANSVPGQVRYATPLTGTLHIAKDKGQPGDGWTTTPGGKRVWGKYGAAGLLLMHQDPVTGERRYLMVQRGPAISDPGKWQFPGGAIDEKETFHEGGAREVIEELGFDKNALNNAQVHGEHTHSIPGSSWKYVSVAAQVPSMLKPDLSTHHARAETSDAKWMTEAEIRKLDTDGKLLAPLAGGKLEQNVLSLFPGTLPNKLGNVVARPGPVTRRQQRLHLPSGGRIPPQQFNAWPHPHKPSTGKNLVSDKTAIDKLRQDVKHARTAYDGKTADGRLAAIGAMQGYDDTPTVVSKKEMDRLLATGDYIEVWRGVRGAGGYSARGSGSPGHKTAAQINEDLRSGPAYYGKGIFGNGYYFATQKSVAQQYADGSHGSILRALIPKSAVTALYPDMEREAHAASSQRSKAKGNTFEEGTLYDPGRWAAAKGIDGIEIQHHHTNKTGGWARHVARSGQPAFNWLNRSVLIVQEA